MDVNEVAQMLEQILTGGGLEAFDADVAFDGVDRETYTAALDQVMENHDVPTEVREQATDGLDAHGGYEPSDLFNHFQALVDNNQIATEVDQSLHTGDSEIHGDVWQENDSNVANATGEGAIAGDEVYGNQVQTGDGQQVGGDSGLQNQGDNSGQQAGYDATADNVTSGDHNTVASGWADRVGEGQVSQDGAYINDSAQAFGEGDAHNEANDSYDSHDTFTETATATDSFNSEYNDNDTQTQSVDTHGGYGEHEYEPLVEHDDYKDGHGHDYGHDDHDHYVDDHAPDIDQHAEILDHN